MIFQTNNKFKVLVFFNYSNKQETKLTYLKLQTVKLVVKVNVSGRKNIIRSLQC